MKWMPATAEYILGVNLNSIKVRLPAVPIYFLVVVERKKICFALPPDCSILSSKFIKIEKVYLYKII